MIPQPVSWLLSTLHNEQTREGCPIVKLFLHGPTVHPEWSCTWWVRWGHVGGRAHGSWILSHGGGYHHKCLIWDRFESHPDAGSMRGTGFCSLDLLFFQGFGSSSFLGFWSEKRLKEFRVRAAFFPDVTLLHPGNSFLNMIGQVRSYCVWPGMSLAYSTTCTHTTHFPHRVT